MESSAEVISKERGLELLKAGKVDEAIEVLSTVLQADEDDAQANMYIGAAYNQKGDKLHAIYHFEESLRLEETPKAYYNLGAVYESSHRLDEAIRQYRVAVQLDPNYTRAIEAIKRIQDQYLQEHPQQ